MDPTVKYANESPEIKAGWFSKLFYWWLHKLFIGGVKKNLQHEDLYNATERDLSNLLGDTLQGYWDKELAKAKMRNKEPSLKYCIMKAFMRSYFFYGVLTFIQGVFLKLAHPLVLREFIKFFDKDNNGPQYEGWLLGLGVVSMSFVNMMTMFHNFTGSWRIGMRMRIACCSLMYRKLLRLNKTGLSQTTPGQLVNLMSNDVQRFENLALYFHYMWVMPIQLIVGTSIMYTYIGYPAFIGTACIVIQAFLVQGTLSHLQGRYRERVAVYTDNRVKLMSEITAGIRIIKMYAWEKPFEKVVELSRKLEVDTIKKKALICGIIISFIVYAERVSLFSTCVAYVLQGNKLTSHLVFSMAQFFNIIQLYTVIFFPLAVGSYAECMVSIKRIQNFLLLSENYKPLLLDTENPVGQITVVKGKASWIPNPIITTLSNINVNIPQGTLCAVVGPVGSGKSSLLKLFLRELPLSSGKLDVNGTMSYSSQESWLFSASIRRNILFGQPYKKELYFKVIDACALIEDFRNLPESDKTLVGEKGVALSGGQKARINLARAVYRKCDIYLLDDPLSAVDTHVGNHLFDECICRYLKGTTRILATHQVQYLKKVDQIILISNGQIEKVGSYEDLAKDLEALEKQSFEHSPMPFKMKETKYSRPSRAKSRLFSTFSVASGAVDEYVEDEEVIEKGAIPFSTYWTYWNVSTPVAVLCFLLLLLITSQIICNSGDLWLKHWTNIEESCQRPAVNSFAMSDNFTNDNSTLIDLSALDCSVVNGTSNATLCNEPISLISERNASESEVLFGAPFNDVDCSHQRDYYIFGYAMFISITVILMISRALLFFKVCTNSSKGLHNRMFNYILQAPMTFFDKNPSGRILNRFSKDIGTVDEFLPSVWFDAVQIMLIMTGILGIIFIVSPIMIIGTIVLILLFRATRWVYLQTAQALRRLEGTTKAPMFSHVSATFSGITTIRSCSAEELLTNEFDILQDQHTGAFFLILCTSQTFGLVIDLTITVFLACVTFHFLFYESVMAGDVGLVISQCLMLTGMLQYGVRQTTEVVSNMTSVERILQYTKLEVEGPFESTPAAKPHRDWPQKGQINFKNVYLQYSPNENPVLRNLNFTIESGEKVGVVGRSGAGKSSIIVGLFRLVNVQGTITIDDVDIGTIGLKDLRSKISIIPQDPILFSTTIRHNLDPFDTFSDEILWKALEDVELKDSIDTLEQEVTEGGENLSAGQRQLMCLARAIIRNNKIIILDEATANVDQVTDSLIQQTIRKNFKDYTVITIAHRLNTIIDCDKVLVMDAGEIAEFDHPHILLQNPHGHFTSLCQQTGGKMFETLSTSAKQQFDAKLEERAKTALKHKEEVKTEPNTAKLEEAKTEPNTARHEEAKTGLNTAKHEEEANTRPSTAKHVEEANTRPSTAKHEEVKTEPKTAKHEDDVKSETDEKED